MAVDRDAELVERAKKGDSAAFDALVGRHYEKIYALAYRFIGNPDSAGDVTQETFLKAFQQLKGFRGDSAFSTWLYRICINCCQDQLRKRRDIAFSQFDGNESEEGVMRENREQDPEELIREREKAEEVRQTLAKLHPQARQILILCDMEKLSYGEVAAILSIPEGTVKSRLHRARWAFKEEWLKQKRNQDKRLGVQRLEK